MDSKVKAKIKGRLLTVISKIEELESIGHDEGVTDDLPELQGMLQDCMSRYMEICVK